MYYRSRFSIDVYAPHNDDRKNEQRDAPHHASIIYAAMSGD